MDRYLKNSIVQELDLVEFTERGISLSIKRDDLIHKEVSGNKWRKLKYNIIQAEQSQKKGVLTFGGAYSNHLIAVAAVCNELSIESIGFVRGDELNSNSNEVMSRCSALGMRLIFISREEYALRNDKMYTDQLKSDFLGFYIVPEGGANYYGMIGCQEIWSEIKKEYDHVFVAQGTTTTSCGLLIGLPEMTALHVVPVLKGFDSISEMRKLLQWSFLDEDDLNALFERTFVHDSYHFGGYGKADNLFIESLNQVVKRIQVPLDKVYTGKAFLAMIDILGDVSFNNSSVLFIHTGGIHSVTE